MPRSPASLSGLFFNTDVAKTTAVSVANIAALQGLSAVTVEAWIYLFSYPLANNGKLFSYFSGNLGYQMSMVPTGTITLQTGNTTTQATSSQTSPISLNSWHKIEGTWDGTNLRMFLDGIQQGANVALATSSGTGNPGVALTIGNTAACAFPGIISELRISNIARHTANYTPETQPLTADANTIGLYHLNEGQGTVVNDSSSQANNGTLTGSSLPVWSDGKFLGGASSRSTASNRVSVQNFPASLAFNNAQTTKVKIPAALGPTFANAYSVEGWFKVYPNAAFTLWSVGNSGVATQFVRLYGSSANPGRLAYEIINDAGTVLDNTLLHTRPTFGQWHHIVVTDNLGVVNVYIDGVADTASLNYTPSGTLTLNQTAMGLLSRTTDQNNLVGNANGFMTYNFALTAQQVLQRYNGISVGTPTGIFLLTEGAGTTAFDTSGNGNNGTITAGTYTADVPSKTRGLVGGNLVYNGNFEYAPPTSVLTTGSGRWIDGTSGGGTDPSGNVFGWAVTSSASGCGAMFDNSTSHSGNFSLKVSSVIVNTDTQTSITPATSPQQILARYGIAVQPNTSYTGSCWIKTQLNSGSSTNGASLDFVERNAAGSSLFTNPVSAIVTTTPWTQYNIVFTTGPNTRFVLPKPHINGTSGATTLIMDAWFDDIVLTPTANTTRSLVP